MKLAELFPEGGRGIIGTADADYMPVVSYTRELGIDLADFKFPAEE